MIRTGNLGFPRIGAQRELKWALERAWRSHEYTELRTTAQDLRARHWKVQAAHGVDEIPVGDFSLFDHVLDTALDLGAVPARFGGLPFDQASGDDTDLDRLFTMARGGTVDGAACAPLELTKWFDTNYHYLVPELSPDQRFRARPGRLLSHVAEAHAIGVSPRVVLVGPVTFLLLSKRTDGGDPFALLDGVLTAYATLLEALTHAGVTSVQFDEPVLVGDLTPDARHAFPRAYDALRAAAPTLRLTLATYFGPLGPHVSLATRLPVDVLHLDLVRGADQLDDVIAHAPDPLTLSLGVVDGRNVWRSDLRALATRLAPAVAHLGAERVQLAPSCSLLHLPFDVAVEDSIDEEVRSWLAFAVQRLDELRVLATALDGDPTTVADALAASDAAQASRHASARVHDPEVTARLAATTSADAQRAHPYAVRKSAQQARLHLPLFPTTTIGSFPQTTDVRNLRRRYRDGVASEDEYVAGLRDATAHAVHLQEELGLDVLVHGEFERTDMVEYFGTRLTGFATTTYGWVQSYGSRCVKPPVIYGDVTRPAPMTVDWATFAAQLTDKPMKGMLTGPVTMLEWSFVRDDQPRAVTARQIALALSDEVADLAAAGIPIIQIDEPALREGLPLRAADRHAYLAWATEAFRLAAGSAPDDVGIHTHMCYASFGDILDAIEALDADVISMEASRSDMELLDDFVTRSYPNEIGPGIWDIHSPRVPGDDELDLLLTRAVDAFGPDRLWVNPDCGLKTRGWEETTSSLRHLVGAAHRARARTS